MHSGNPAPPLSCNPSPCVVIPAYQAQATIGPLVKAVAALGLPVLVVDDASRDATIREAEAAGARVIRRPVNGGKGTALREGMAAALKEGYHWILTMDADGQHLPEEIPRFFEAAGRGTTDLILGNRMRAPQGMPLDRWVTNRAMSWFLSRISGQPLPDTQCGFRLISRRLLETVSLTCERFEVESELVVKAAWAGCRIRSVPVSSVYRRNLSFIRPLRDTVRFFRLLFILWKDRQSLARAPS